MSELKPCPFCGGKAELDSEYHKVSCALEWGSCSVMPETWGCDTDEEAIEAWNRRVGMNIDDKLDEQYKLIKNYIKEDQELKEMCNRCGNYLGEEHDYEDCRNEQCFRFFLGYRSLEHSTSYEAFPEMMGR